MHIPEEKTPPDFNFQFTDQTLYLNGSLTIENLSTRFSGLQRLVSRYSRNEIIFDLKGVRHIDSSGTAVLDFLKNKLEQKGVRVHIQNASAEIEHIRKIFATPPPETVKSRKAPATFLENLGDAGFDSLAAFKEFLFLTSDLTFWSVVDLFKSKAHRKGEFINQVVTIGVNAIPLIAFISFLIGFVLALQSSEQLRQFGANIFIVDLTVISMTREMGPLLTAILVAGRSGSAIASEIATMKVTEELDALKTMSLDPLRFVVVPKLQASVFSLPILTLIADVVGIIGGMMIAYFTMDLSTQVFYNRILDTLELRDIVTGIVKSLIFAGIIVLTGSFFGFRAGGGSEGVGKVTTSAVVTSIFLVIFADSILGLIFY